MSLSFNIESRATPFFADHSSQISSPATQAPLSSSGAGTLDEGFIDNCESPRRDDRDEPQKIQPALVAISSSHKSNSSFSSSFDKPAQNPIGKFEDKPLNPASPPILDLEELAKKIPAWNSYKILDRSLNEEHKNIYGGQQKIYLEETQKSVGYTLLAMSELREPSSEAFVNQPPGYSFTRQLLSDLGNRRMETAWLCDTDRGFLFGEERSRILHTPIGPQYKTYEERVSELQGVQLKFAFGSKEYLLTEYCPPIADNPQSSGRKALILHRYANFWEKEDPLFSHIESLCEKIILSDYATAEDLRKEIADLHWLLANIVPFKRGTASILEVLTDALWLLHGYIPGHIEQGKSLDLEALTNERETFQRIYPLGEKASERLS